jgi:hypothetical protein
MRTGIRKRCCRIVAVANARFSIIFLY